MSGQKNLSHKNAHKVSKKDECDFRTLFNVKRHFNIMTSHDYKLEHPPYSLSPSPAGLSKEEKSGVRRERRETASRRTWLCSVSVDRNRELDATEHRFISHTQI